MKTVVRLGKSHIELAIRFTLEITSLLFAHGGAIVGTVNDELVIDSPLN